MIAFIYLYKIQRNSIVIEDKYEYSRWSDDTKCIKSQFLMISCVFFLYGAKQNDK